MLRRAAAKGEPKSRQVSQRLCIASSVTFSAASGYSRFIIVSPLCQTVGQTPGHLGCSLLGGFTHPACSSVSSISAQEENCIAAGRLGTIFSTVLRRAPLKLEPG